MNNIKKFKDFNSQNESVRNWISTFLLLTSLGVISKPESEKMPDSEKKEIVDNLDYKQIDSLSITNDLINVGTDDYKKLEDVYNNSRKGTEFKETPFLDFIQDVSEFSKDMVSVEMFLVDIPIPGAILLNTPLYGVRIDKKMVLRSTLLGRDFKNQKIIDLSAEYDVSDKLKVVFMVNPMFKSFSVNYKF